MIIPKTNDVHFNDFWGEYLENYLIEFDIKYVEF